MKNPFEGLMGQKNTNKIEVAFDDLPPLVLETFHSLTDNYTHANDEGVYKRETGIHIENLEEGRQYTVKGVIQFKNRDERWLEYDFDIVIKTDENDNVIDSQKIQGKTHPVS